ncbi:hypothetical protein V3C33_13275 [Micrococcaceae bacterium Sec5.7]
MKKTIAAIGIAGIAGLTACSPAVAVPVKTTAPPTPSSSAVASPSESASPDASGESTAAAAGVKESCELFYTLYAEYKALPGTDANAYEDIYLKSEDAKRNTAADITGLFASLSLLAIDHASAAESGGRPAQDSKDAVRDAVFANAGACTAEGVTLRL